jgi:hypothetical protein
MDRRRFIEAAAFGTLATLFSPVTQASTGYSRPNKDVVDRTDINNLNKNYFRHATLGSTNPAPVGLRLVCLFDDSLSINDAEYKIQLESMADAVSNEDFQHALFYPGGPQSLAICFVNLSRYIRIPWIDIRKGEDYKFDLLRQEVMDMHKEFPHGPTYLRRGLTDARVAMQNCPWQAKRNVINLITDGTEREPDTSEQSSIKVAEYIKTLADEDETTVNALITLGDNTYSPNIEEWSEKYYYTRPGHYKKDGRPLDPGFIEIVAHDLNDSQKNEIYLVKKAMRMAFRRVALVQVAELDQQHQAPAIMTAQNFASPSMPKIL